MVFMAPAQRMMWRHLALAALLFAFTAPVLSQTREQKAQALIDAYPDQLAAFDGTDLIWKDGTHMPFGDGDPNKSLDAIYDHPDIADMFRWRYTFDGAGLPAQPESDPGRVRNEA